MAENDKRIEEWGTFLWERRADVPPISVDKKLPGYPNETPGGVVYRLRFFHENQWRHYIGVSGSTVRARLIKHLGDARDNAHPQKMMREHHNRDPIQVWTLSRKSTLNIFDQPVFATGADKFNRLLFEAAAVIYAVQKFHDEELLNRPSSAAPGTHKKGKPIAVLH